MRQKIVKDLATGETSVIPYTPEEEAAADAAQLAEQNDPIRALQIADSQAKDTARQDAVIQYLVNHTPAECEAYVQTNVTDLVSAKAFLKKVAVALCVLSKGQLR